MAPKELEKVLYFAASIVTCGRRGEARRRDLADLEDKVRGESEQIYVDRDEQLAGARRAPRAPSRLPHGRQGQGLRRGRRVLGARALELGRGPGDALARGGARRSQARSSRSSRRPSPARTRSGSASSSARRRRATTAGSPRARSSRSRTPPQEIRTALEPLRNELEKASGAKKGAITKHLHKLLDQLLSGDELSGDDAELVASVDAKNLERAREIGNGLLRDVLEQAETDAGPEQVRELAYDLCLVEGARKEDLDAVVQWATKVQEMFADIESRREDTREAAVEGVRRLEDTWKLFRELDVEAGRQRRAAVPRAQGPLRLAVRLRRVLPRRHGRGGDPRPARATSTSSRERSRCATTIKTSKGQKQQRAIKRLKVVSAFLTSENKPGVDGPRGRAR